MAPHSSTITETVRDDTPKQKQIYPPVVKANVVVFGLVHLGALYGAYLAFTIGMWRTWMFGTFLGICSGLGVTAGAHRLWSHRSYKAKWPLRLLLVIFNCFACQNDIYEWSRDHRVHHKYSETDADPHNANRGFFFAHAGWLMTKKHPDVFQKGKSVDCSDILADPLVRFQKKYYIPLVAILCYIVPSYIPMLWGETATIGFFCAGLMRHVISLHATWLVNSAAHMWGNKPYDKYISAGDNNFVAIGAIGEGFHNYHHTFPWDYATSELGWRLNLTTMFIDTMAWLGLAYDLKTATPDIIRYRRNRTGELSH